MPIRQRSAPIDRVSPTDLTVLATDRGAVPMNIGALLEFAADDGPSWAEIETLLIKRLPAIARLRQRLRRSPPGCGRPVWVDDPDFRLGRHLLRDQAASRPELLAITARAVCDRLDPGRPLWRATLVTDATGRGIGLVVVLHHVLADGLGGLALLAALAETTEMEPDPDFPRPQPRWQALAVDAVRSRLDSLRGTPGGLRRAAAGVGELGIGRTRPRLLTPTSLNRPTSARRRLDRMAVPLADVVDVAHRNAGTVNDVVLAAVTGALIEVLADRGEHPSELVVSVPISRRRSATTRQLGNDTGVRPVAVPTIGDHQARLAEIVHRTAQPAPSQRASSALPLGLMFRTLGRLRLFNLFVDHQRLVHTFETNLRGPAEPISIAGHRVRTIVPAAVNPGNVAVSFDVLSYAGDLGVTVVTDPTVIDEPAHLTAALGRMFEALFRLPPGHPRR